MEFEYIYEEYLEGLLEALINERLQYNNRFLNVSVYHNTTSLTIKWFETQDNPSGDIDFSERVIPFNFLHVYAEIGRQYNKLNRKV